MSRKTSFVFGWIFCLAAGPLMGGTAVDALAAAAGPARARDAAPEPQMAAQPAVESRGVWVDKSDLYRGKEYLTAALDKLKEMNLNTLYLPVWHKGYVTYQGSAYVPLDPDLAKVDPALLSWLVAEAHKRGFMVQAWTEYGFGTFYTPDPSSSPSRGAILDRHPELTAIDDEGNPYEHIPEWGYFYHMCPANPASHEILADLLAEAVTALPFDALNLDRIRFPGEHFCFCPYCKAKFKEDTGYELDPSIFSDPGRMAAWVKWRKARVTDFMALLSAKIRAARPGVPITSAVWYNSELDNKGQDWPTWMRKGYLDFAVPMIYWAGNDDTVNGTVSLAPSARRTAVGISAADCTKEEVARQVRYARSKRTGGVAFWYLNPLLGMADYLEDLFPSPALPYAGAAQKKAAAR